MSNEVKQAVRDMIENWREEYNSIKEQLIVNGAEAHKNEYNLLATEALRLSLCMNDAVDLLIQMLEEEAKAK